MDPRAAAKTLGISDEAAEGFVRLAEKNKQVKAAQERLAAASSNLAEQYSQSGGVVEKWQRNINRGTSALAKPLSVLTDIANGVLTGTAKSSAGASAVVGGTAATAALLAGSGAGGLAGLLGGLAKTAAVEKATGRDVQPVYVTNFGELNESLLKKVGDKAMGGAAGLLGGGAAGVSALGLAAAGVGAGLAAFFYPTSTADQDEADDLRAYRDQIAKNRPDVNDAGAAAVLREIDQKLELLTGHAAKQTTIQKQHLEESKRTNHQRLFKDTARGSRGAAQ
jgi:hypothetical protein